MNNNNDKLKTISSIFPKTLPEMVIPVLREAILSGELPGGMQLKQEEWALHFKVSLTALREALKILESEGLVKFYPNRGAIVTELSVEEAQEIYEIRVFLEVGAIEFAIPNLMPQDIAEAKALLQQSADLTNSDQWGDLNWRIHEVLYRRAKKPKLYRLIKTLYNNVERYMRIYFSNDKYQSLAIKEHTQIIEACEQKDIETAKQILRKHIMDTGIVVTNYLNSVDTNKEKW